MNRFQNVDIKPDEKRMRINALRQMVDNIQDLKEDGLLDGDHIEKTIADLNGLISELKELKN